MPCTTDSASGRSVAIYLLGGALLLWLLFELRMLVLIVIMSVTLASAMSPLAEKGEQKGVSRTVTVVALYVLAAVVYLLLMATMFPMLKEQVVNLREQLPGYMTVLTDKYQDVLQLAGEKARLLAVQSADLKSIGAKVLQQTVQITSGLFGLIINSILMLFLAAYFVVESKVIWPRINQWIPEKQRPRLANVVASCKKRLGGYVRGQLLVSLAVGTIVGGGLTLLGVHYSLLLGLLAGLLNLMPYVGSMISAVLAVTIAFNQSPLLAGLTVALYMGEQWLETSVIVPQLLGNQVLLHPLVVLFALLIGATLMGVPGALVSVPVTCIVIAFLEEYYLSGLKSET
jgi:predicted PurR-regulated permease PerM